MSDVVRLPRASEAKIAAEKLRDYALNPEHPTGHDKARVFRSALDIGQDDWEFLRDQILERVPEAPVTAVRPNPPWGVEYDVRIPVDGHNGETHRVITGWLVIEDAAPRLITLYVELPQRRD